jgi:hypothetical protein
MNAHNNTLSPSKTNHIALESAQPNPVNLTWTPDDPSIPNNVNRGKQNLKLSQYLEHQNRLTESIYGQDT